MNNYIGRSSWRAFRSESKQASGEDEAYNEVDHCEHQDQLQNVRAHHQRTCALSNNCSAHAKQFDTKRNQNSEHNVNHNFDSLASSNVTRIVDPAVINSNRRASHPLTRATHRGTQANEFHLSPLHSAPEDSLRLITTTATSTVASKVPSTRSQAKSAKLYYISLKSILHWILAIWIAVGVVIYVVNLRRYTKPTVTLFGVPAYAVYGIALCNHCALIIAILCYIGALLIIATVVQCALLVAIPALIVDVVPTLLTYAYILSSLVMLLCYGVLYMRTSTSARAAATPAITACPTVATAAPPPPSHASFGWPVNNTTAHMAPTTTSAIDPNHLKSYHPLPSDHFERTDKLTPFESIELDSEAEINKNTLDDKMDPNSAQSKGSSSQSYPTDQRAVAKDETFVGQLHAKQSISQVSVPRNSCQF